ncbi:hypothetical protein THIOKS11320071 [Thiocapsa sp. KS1]|nr:hypothetical protein [Thiocapsa sp. KS1]CRI63422.1 hypothetical protein THIOKS11320071 [Thiocapsa sp. KS1]
MKLTAAHVEVFDRYTQPRLADWLLTALVSWVREDVEDPFYPHSFLNLFETPIEGIEHLYSIASIKSKRSLRAAIPRSAALCRPTSPDLYTLDPLKRINLFKAFIRLTEHALCFDSAPHLGDIATCDLGYWDEAGLAEEVFADCLRCSGHLSINHADSIFWREEMGSPLENTLVRLVASPHFTPSFTPFAFYALVSIAPERLVHHLALLGPLIARLHENDPSQVQLAYHTANRIVERAPLHLFSIFPQLNFRYPFSQDRWLVEALFSDFGPLQLQRFGLDVTRPRALRKGQPNKWILLPHEDWAFFQPEAVQQMPSGLSGTPPKNAAIANTGKEIFAFFHSKRRVERSYQTRGISS